MKLPLWKAILPIVLLVILLTVNISIFKDDALSGSSQFILLLCAFVSLLIGCFQKIKFEKFIESIKGQISNVSEALIILLLVGGLTSTWLTSGIIPTMVYYGLQIIHPKVFLVSCVLICIIVSVITGSSWTTSATIGIALIGIAKSLGIDLGMTAGAILSGAYFGDKLSPLSDTTNLASSISGASLIDHIKYMLWTTVPTIVLTLIIFGVLGFVIDINSIQVEKININDFNHSFNISLGLLIIPLIIFVLIIFKTPAIVSLLIGIIFGGLATIFVQPQLISQIAQMEVYSFTSCYKAILTTISVGTEITTPNQHLADLFSCSGMSGMLNTIWLIICAMVFGGSLKALGALEKISTSILKLSKGEKGLFLGTIGMTLFTNITTSDQYLSLVIPGKMFKNAFAEKNLAPENLSRTLEDSGTVTSVLIPWNTCGNFHSQTLGVSVYDYFIYAFFNWLSPLTSMLFAILGIKIRKLMLKTTA